MEQIDQILALTDRVQQCVDKGHWTEANALEAERLAMLTELFARDDIGSFGPACENLARDLLTRNSGMIQTLGMQRERLNETTRKLNAAPRAIHAYRTNAQPGHGRGAGTTD